MQLYYVNGLMMTNLCGYGNHYACDSTTCECPHHEVVTPDPEPEPETDETDLVEQDGKSFRFD